jgi:hypothetical protein
MTRSTIRLTITLVAVLLLAAVTPTAAGHRGDHSKWVTKLRQVQADLEEATLASHGSGHAPARTRKLTLVGQNDLGGGGFNTDVWAQGKTAYVGTWGAFTPEGLFCPATGTKVIDIADPTDPAVVEVLPTEPGTQTNDVKVEKVNTEFFKGDLLVVSNEDCMTPGARGFELWDVSDPLNPEFLSRFGPEVAFDEEPFLSEIGFGVHNTFIFEQGKRVYVAAVVDFAEIFQFIFGGSDPAAATVGDLRIVDVTDPTNPVQVGDWGFVKDLGMDPFAVGGGAEPFAFVHDVTVENDIAYASWWDAGLILLDVSDPANPEFISRTDYPDAEEGNTHAAWPAHGGNLVVTSDEDFEPDPWGFMRVFDSQDESSPTQVGTFATPNTLTGDPADGIFSIHNVLVRGNTVYISWYSDGVRLVDISNPAAPKEIGAFVPPPVADPWGIFPTAAVEWGVHPTGKLILASDINAGLYILRTKP